MAFTVEIQNGCSPLSVTPSVGVDQTVFLGTSPGQYQVDPFTYSDPDCNISYLTDITPDTAGKDTSWLTIVERGIGWPLITDSSKIGDYTIVIKSFIACFHGDDFKTEFTLKIVSCESDTLTVNLQTPPDIPIYEAAVYTWTNTNNEVTSSAGVLAHCGPIIWTVTASDGGSPDTTIFTVNDLTLEPKTIDILSS